MQQKRYSVYLLRTWSFVEGDSQRSWLEKHDILPMHVRRF